jgi:transcription antitermination factor NusG
MDEDTVVPEETPVKAVKAVKAFAEEPAAPEAPDQNAIETLVGHFVQIVEGKFKGLYGVLVNLFEEDGKKAEVKLRDHSQDAERVVVDAEHVAATDYKGGR